MIKLNINMIKQSIRRVCGLALSFILAGSLAISCYDDSELRSSINDLKSQLSQLQSLVSTLQNDDAVTGVTQNPDGSYTINFKKSGAVTIRNGADGKPGDPGKDGAIVSVTKGEDTYVFTLSDGSTIVLPRYSEIRVLTFEDADYKGTANTTTYWSSLIDDPEYGGPILYGQGCTWYDENNTFITSTILPQDYEAYTYGYSSGGIAISNYGNAILADADYMRQLEVVNFDVDGFTRTSAGNRGSDNFAVVFDAGVYNPATLAMKDGVARVFESVCVNNTCYTLNILINGNDYAAPMAKNGFFKVVATGYVGDVVVGTSEYFLARNIYFVSEWMKWDLSKLGAVDKVVFSIAGSPEQYGDWGINTPAYFAIDDVTVRYYPD